MNSDTRARSGWKAQALSLQSQLASLENEQKKLQDELCAAKEANQLLVEQAPTAIYEIDFRGLCFTSVNDAMCRNLGYSREELMAMNPFDLLDEAGKQIFQERIRKNLAGDIIEPTVEYKIRGKSGREIYAILNTSVRYHEGKPQSAIVIAHDISERKQMEDSLRESQRKTSEILESISDAFYSLDREGRFIYANQKAMSLWGKQSEDLIGKNIWEVFPSGKDTESYDKIQGALVNQQPCQYESYSAFLARWTNISLYPTEGGLSVYFQDITRRKQMEEALTRSEEKFERAFQYNPAAMTITRVSDGLYTDANESFCRMVGYQREEIVGRSPVDLGFFCQEERDQVLRQFSTEGSVHQQEFSGRTREGKVRRVLFSLDPIEASGEPAILATMIDITERVQADEALRQRNMMLSLLTDAAAELLAGADPIEKLDEFFGRAGKVLGLEVYVQYNLSEDGTYLKLGRISGFPEKYLKLLSRLQLGQAVCGTVAQTRRPMYVNNVQDQEDKKTRLIRKLGIGTYACHPLMVGDRLLGTLSFGSRSHSHFDPETIGILKSFCSMVAEAIARKQMEKALQESEERERLRAAEMEAVFEALPVGVAITDSRGGNVQANHTFEDIWGSQRPLVQSIEDYQAYKAWWADTGKEVTPEEWASAQVVQAGIPVVGQFMEIQRFNGKKAFILNSASPVRDHKGNIVGSAVAIQDVTRLHEAEQMLKEANMLLEHRVEERTYELRRTNERVQALAEVYELLTEAGTNLPDVLQSVVKKTAEIFGDGCVLRLLDDDGQWLNSSASHDLDPQRSERLADSLRPTLQRSDEMVAGNVFQIGAGKIFQVHNMADWDEIEKGEFAAYLKTSHATSRMVVPLRIEQKVIGTIGLVCYSPEKPYTQEELIFLQDLADRAALAIHNARLFKDLEQSLSKERYMRQQLIQGEKYAALARLVASVAHELNNPLQAIQNCIYLLNDTILPDDSLQWMNIISSEGKRMSFLVQQLRETYRPSSVKQEDCNLIEILTRSLNLLGPQLHQDHIEWSMHSDQERILINGVPDQLKQVFINIIINAIDSMEEKGGQLKVSVSRTGGSVCIAFQDTGSGIQPDDLEKIFEPFFTTKWQGTGLGLSICYEIVKDHKGAITVESAPGKGTTFYISLPVKSD